MNLSVILYESIDVDGNLKTCSIIPSNEHNRIIVNKLQDIEATCNKRNDKDIGLLRVHGINRHQIIERCVKPESFERTNNAEYIEFTFSKVGVFVGSSNEGCGGYYYFFLPKGYKFTHLSIVDPLKKSKKPIEEQKQLKYILHYDKEQDIQIIEMMLVSQYGSFNFILKARASCQLENLNFLPYGEASVAINKEQTFFSLILDCAIIAPNFNGIGFDFKKFFKR